MNRDPHFAPHGYGSSSLPTGKQHCGSAVASAAVPAFSPHDLRHRRVSPMHAQGVSWAARIGEQVGHDDIATTSRVYTHVVADERELDYARRRSRERVRAVLSPVPSSAEE